MPFRCNNCLTLTDSDDNDCCNEPSPVRVAVVHYLHPDGPGRVITTQRRITRDSAESVIAIRNSLRLGCESSVSQPIATAHFPAVTCLACRKNFNPKE